MTKETEFFAGLVDIGKKEQGINSTWWKDGQEVKTIHDLYLLNREVVFNSYKNLLEHRQISSKSTLKEKKIARFIDLVCDFSEENLVGAICRQLIWSISGLSIQDNYFHSHDSVCNLDNFVSNYFLDDAYFKVCNDEVHGVKLGLTMKNDDTQSISQDPDLIIRTAKRIIKERKKK